MKKFMRNILSVVVSAALLVSSTIPVLAADPGDSGHSHEGGTAIEGDKNATYTITLTPPTGYPEITDDNKTNFSYGAYQIFSGTVPKNPQSVEGSEYDKNKDGYQNPGDNLAALPITDIKWGNAFGTVSTPTWQDNIVNFVLALAEAPTGDYSYAFHDFHGFEDFDNADNTKLADIYYVDKDNDGIEEDERINANVNFDKLAVAVAEVLAAKGHQNNEWLQAFTDILGGYSAPTKPGEVYGQGNFVTQYYAGEWKEKVGDKYTKFQITVPAGYYMIKDFSSIDGDSLDKEDGEAYSARMLFVASDVTQVLKESVPTLEKHIVRSDKNEYETEAAGVGDVVTYKLTGTLPSNYDNYLGGYQYIFTDTLSEGLTLNELKDTSGTYVTVTAKGWWKTSSDDTKTWVDEELPIDLKSFDADADDSHSHHLGGDTGNDSAYKEEVKNIEDGGGTLTVTFPCLKEIVVEKEGNEYRLGYNAEATGEIMSSQIYVTYTATVNQNAVVSPKEGTSYNGNMNSAQLKYSDNPQSYTDTDETTTDTATVYTFGLEITKVNASEFIKADGLVNSDVVLANVDFALIRQNPDASGTYQIAEFSDVDETGKTEDPFGGKKYKSIAKWTDLTVGSGQTLQDAVKAFLYTASGTTDSGKGVYILKSDDEGNIRISGLNDDTTYTMVESKAPEGFATIDPFTFSLTAAKVGGSGADKDEYTGQLESVTVTKGIGDKDPVDLEHYVDITNEGFTSAAVSSSSSDPAEIKYTAGTEGNKGIIEMLVDNFEYENLPSTGGMGTYLYYIIGGGVILLAAVLFFLSRKKPAKTVK